jgi:hypothetical protein
VLLCGALATIGAIAGPAPESTSARDAAAVDSPTSQATDSPSSAPTTQASSVAPSPTLAASPTIEKRTVVEKQAIPFATKRVSDPKLPKGTTRVTTRGVAGIKTLTYEVAFTDGVQTGKKLLRQQVTKQPVTQIIAVGTKVTQQCDPNYSGACVPIASDVDCAGGSGDGPAYVQGPVRVIGRDIYDLDRDGDGIGCDS